MWHVRKAGYLLFFMLAGCTLNLQNIDTHGETSDLVDENLTNTPDISADLSLPASL